MNELCGLGLTLHTVPCVRQIWWEAAVQLRKLNPLLCDDLDEWDRRLGWEGGHEGGCVYRQLIHVIVQQKLTALLVIIF